MVVTPGREPRPPQLRPLNLPQPVRVIPGADGEPRAVRVRSRTEPVLRVRDRWRVDDHWWTEEPVSRMYYELELADGRLLTLFHDTLHDQWCQQRG